MSTKKIHLLGELAQFGETWTTTESTLVSIFKLIECQQKGFKSFLMEALDSGLELAIVSANGLSIDNPLEIYMNNLVEEDLFITLIPAGSGKGWGKILAGVFIAFVSFYTFGAAAAAGGKAAGAALNIGYSVAVSLALQGVTQLLTKTPQTQKEEEGPGLFNGPINTVKSGKPVPILYGELLIGGAPIHVNIGPRTGELEGLPAYLEAGANESAQPESADNYVVGTTPGAADVNPTPAFVAPEDLQEILDGILSGDIQIDIGLIGLS